MAHFVAFYVLLGSSEYDTQDVCALEKDSDCSDQIFRFLWHGYITVNVYVMIFKMFSLISSLEVSSAQNKNKKLLKTNIVR